MKAIRLQPDEGYLVEHSRKVYPDHTRRRLAYVYRKHACTYRDLSRSPGSTLARQQTRSLMRYNARLWRLYSSAKKVLVGGPSEGAAGGTESISTAREVFLVGGAPRGGAAGGIAAINRNYFRFYRSVMKCVKRPTHRFGLRTYSAFVRQEWDCYGHEMEASQW